jgi:hypothetical protein
MDSSGGVLAGELHPTDPQKTTVRIARVVYFRNIDVTDEDIEYLIRHLPMGTLSGEQIAGLLVDKKHQLQTKVWVSAVV